MITSVEKSEFILYSRLGRTDPNWTNLHDAGRLDIVYNMQSPISSSPPQTHHMNTSFCYI